MTTEELTKILNDRVAISPPPPKQPLSQAQLNDVMDKFATKLNDIFSKQDQQPSKPVNDAKKEGQ